MVSIKDVYQNPFSLLWSFLSLVLLYSIAFSYSLFKTNANIADITWHVAFIFQVFLYYFFYLAKSPFILHKLFFSIILLINFLRNLYFTIIKQNLRQFEHKRYYKMRSYYPSSFYWISYFTIFLFQLLVNFSIAHLIFVFETVNENKEIYLPTFILGCVLMGLGEVYALIADWQLNAFKKNQVDNLKNDLNLNARSDNVVYDDGLFRYCRFPNFFGEGVFWFGVFLVNVSAEIYHTILCLMVLLLYFINIVKVENINYEVFPEEVKKYIRTTSTFFPWWKLEDKGEEAFRTRRSNEMIINHNNENNNLSIISHRIKEDEEEALNRKI